MVDCQLTDIDQVNPKQRREIILYLINNKSVKPRDLGVDSSYIGKVRRSEVRVGDGLLCQALRFLDDQELALLLKGIVPERRASFDDVVRVVATARVDPALREFLLSLVKEYLSDYLMAMQGMYGVSKEEINEFIKAKRLKGLSEKTGVLPKAQEAP
ncbi:hypothetical protein [Vulcanisaeta distributa]|uniref:hypothetical protein n=1 Tax=Vulcanisaeta distributa TaxID=164451 RepID=UPI0006CF557B|nr:hypothetical protein [Vulcanisaeta distributa]